MTFQEEDWSAQQESRLNQLVGVGGRPGIARQYAVMGRSGREILEAMMSGALPYPPMNDTMNMMLMTIGEGFAVFQGIAQERHRNPMGTIHGGWLTTLMDSALGCAIQTTLPVGRTYTTAQLNINLVRAATHESGPLRAIAKVIHCGRKIATAQAHLEDEAGKLYAHATTTCAILHSPQ